MNTKRYFQKSALLSVLFISVVFSSIKAQELISNGGFETYTGLPTGSSDWALCTGWNNCGGTGSPDFVHMMGTGYANMPFTYWGTVYPQEGNAAMGFKTFKSYYSGFREYITTPFTTPMVPGATYTIRFWLTNCEAAWAYGAGSNHVGIRFSQNMLHQVSDDPILLTPQLQILGIVFNTEWQEYEFTYTADSAYHYITFGNFYSDAMTSWANFEPSDYPGGVEYFIDGISVSVAVPVTTINADICEGEIYTFPDGTTADHTCIDTTVLTGVAGVDSLVITHLTAHPPFTFSQVQHICSGDSLMLPGGMYTAVAGIYTDHFFTVWGCDSVITTQVITDPIYDNTVNAFTCFGVPYLLPDGTTATTTGIYTTHLFTVSGCDSMITTILNVSAENVTDINAEICDGETYILPDGTPTATAGTYTHIFTTAAGCDSVMHTHLTVHPAYHFINNISLCEGETFTLPDGTVTGAAGTYNINYNTILGCDSNFIVHVFIYDTSYQEIDEAICAGENYMLPDGISVSTTGNYTTHLFTVHGCDSMIVTHLLVHDPVIISMAVPDQICFESSSIELMALPDGGVFSGTGITGNYFDPSLTPGTDIYAVTYNYTDDFGCAFSSAQNITVLQNFADAGPDATIAYGASAVINSSSGGDYMWTPVDYLSCENCAAPTANPPVTTTYILTSTDANGCVADDTVTIGVDILTTDDIFIPNTFTPNGDGVNDHFMPLGAGIMEIISFQIFDRWGACIYHGENIPVNDPASGWDGNISGNPANSGVYAYMIELRYVTNILAKKYGNVTLVR